ncbi:Os04g0119200, partial [Oryza sativa Japonica Group]
GPRTCAVWRRGRAAVRRRRLPAASAEGGAKAGRSLGSASGGGDCSLVCSVLVGGCGRGFRLRRARLRRRQEAPRRAGGASTAAAVRRWGSARRAGRQSTRPPYRYAMRQPNDHGLPAWHGLREGLDSLIHCIDLF